eukprot:TRINITY_DN10903_c0_g1_i2.p1 TRINITY_DN10903_c0_g1~~TRINITY_DN10903_c0_g1_i2.p1  ORF type:complete len:381 (-),score=32.52 TRINITY_DN10903_c0_g1_i2:482-1624(-)
MDLAGFGLGRSVARPSLVWRQKTRTPTFFSQLSFAPDGGLSKVHELWTLDKWLWAVLKVAWLVLNVMTIVFSGARNIYCQECHGWRKLWVPRDRFLVTDLLWEITMCRGVEVCEYPNMALWLAVVEMLILMGLFCYGLRLVILAVRDDSAGTVHRWHYIAVFFWYMPPLIVSFSGMRALYFVAPSVFLPALAQEITKSYRRQASGYTSGLLRFLLFHLALAWLGVDAFTVKLHLIADALHQELTQKEHFLIVAGFTNQLLRVVQIEEFVRRRLYIFVFSGREGNMTDAEEAARITWEAMLTKQIYYSFPLYKFLVIMLSYGDYDFQRLLLVEQQQHSDSVIGLNSLGAYTSAIGAFSSSFQPGDMVQLARLDEHADEQPV